MSGNPTQYGRRDVLKAGALIAGGALVFSVASPLRTTPQFSRHRA